MVGGHDDERHVPTHMQLGLCCGTHKRIFALDANDLCEVLSQGSSCGASEARLARTTPLANRLPPTRYLVDLREKCFNCLSSHIGWGNLQAASTLPPMQRVLTSHVGLQVAADDAS